MNPHEFLAGALQLAQDEAVLSPRTVDLLRGLLQNPLSKPECDDVWERLSGADEARFRRDTRSVVVAGIAQCLGDHRISADERLMVRYVKALFRIDDGALYEHCRTDLVDLIGAELATIDGEDQEHGTAAPHVVMLQELLGLSYDQFCDLLEEARRPLTHWLRDRPGT